MKAEQLKLVLDSLALVQPLADEIAKSFYKHLFEIAPPTKKLFTGDMERQGTMLMTSLSLAVSGLSNMEEILPSVQALGDKSGLKRYGTGFNGEPKKQSRGEAYVPMDECLARCVIDFSGRPYLVWRGMDNLGFKKLTRTEKKQDMSSAFRFGLAREFFQGFTNEARCNLHLELLYGEEPHHVVEALFKAFAKAVDCACQRDPRIAGHLPSTKGKL